MNLFFIRECAEIPCTLCYRLRVLYATAFMSGYLQIAQTHCRNSQIASDVAELDEIDVLFKSIRLSIRIDRHADLW